MISLLKNQIKKASYILYKQNTMKLEHELSKEHEIK